MAGAVSASAQLRLALPRCRNHALRSINKRTIVSEIPFNGRPLVSYPSLEKTTSSSRYQCLGQSILNPSKTRGFSSSATRLEQYQSEHTYPSFADERRLALARYPHLKDRKARADIIHTRDKAIAIYERHALANGEAPGVPWAELEPYFHLICEYLAAWCLEPNANRRDSYEERKAMFEYFVQELHKWETFKDQGNEWQRAKPEAKTSSETELRQSVDIIQLLVICAVLMSFVETVVKRWWQPRKKKSMT